MDKVTMFNILSVLSAVGVLVCLIFVRRLRSYVDSPAWTLKQWAFLCFFLAQVGGLLNISLFNAGLNWLGLVNTGLRTVGLGLLAASYIEHEKLFKALFKRFRIKTTPIDVGKVDTSK